MKSYFTVILAFISLIINAQTSFQDSPSGEEQGDFPSKWELLKGSAEVASLSGTPIIYLANGSIITPKIGSKEYLSDSFTLEFEAYFDEITYEVHNHLYKVRFWDGIAYGRFDNRNGSGLYHPMNIYRHGAQIKGDTNHTVYKDELKVIEGTWRSIEIRYNSGALKVFIDRVQILNIPNYKLIPSMVSIEGYTLNSGKPQVLAIKNIVLTGINNNGSNNDIVDHDSVVSDEPNNNVTGTNTYNLPEEDGLPNQILQTDGNGNLTWVDLPSASDTSDSPQNTAPSSGLEAINEGNGKGWRLKYRNTDFHGNIGENAVDLSYSYFGEDNHGATGNSSLAFGTSAISSGNQSIALGRSARATGQNSLAIGDLAYATEEGGIAIGVNMRALEEYSTALGYQSWASGKYSVVLGNDARASADNAFAIGSSVTASGKYSMAIGNGTEATEEGSYAIGFNSKSSNIGAYAIGSGAIASGWMSTAIGFSAKAEGQFSFASGNKTVALGSYSTALGYETKSEASQSVAIGYYNIGGGSPRDVLHSDPLFEIGNGNSQESSNALTVLKNGNVGIGDHKPKVKLQISNGTDASLNYGSGYVIIGKESGKSIVFDNNEILARDRGNSSTLHFKIVAEMCMLVEL